MSNETTELIQKTISYYDNHGIEKILDSHPGFVVDDFRNLLKALKKEYELY